MSLAIRKNLTTESMDNEGEGKSRFAVPKFSLSAKSLTKFLKKPKKSPGQVTDLKDLPNIRPADRHPDAPARQPIFASSDLGLPLAEKIQRFDQSVFEQDIAEPEESVAQPSVMAEPVIAKQEPQPQRVEAPMQNPTEQIAKPVAAVTPKADLSALSLAQLADRLEAGLARLEALQMREPVARPPASPAAGPVSENEVFASSASESLAPVSIPPLRSVDPVDSPEPVEINRQDSRQADMDAALKAALGTLEKMTVQR